MSENQTKLTEQSFSIGDSIQDIEHQDISFDQITDDKEYSQERARQDKKYRIFKRFEQDGKQETHQNDKIQYIQYDQAQQIKQQIKNNQEQKKPKWSRCTKINKQVVVEKSTKKEKKQLKMDTNIFERNQKWRKVQDRKKFEQSRLHFVREKQFCYFEPKLI